jgi:14-3-3 protein epsilon
MLQLLEIDDTFLNDEERNLFMKTSKAKFSIYRNGRKNMLDFEQSELDNNYITIPKRMIEQEMEFLEKNIREFSLNTIFIVEKLEQNAKEDIPALIFYKKMKADYQRYYAEVSNEDEFTKYVENAEENYKFAYEKCLNFLEPHNPLTLAVALNFSVFIYFLLDDTKQAYDIAENVYRQAILNLNTETKIPEVESLIKAIEENLTIWKIELIDIN